MVHLKIPLIVFLIQALRHKKTEQINDYQSSSSHNHKIASLKKAIGEPKPRFLTVFPKTSFLSEFREISTLLSRFEKSASIVESILLHEKTLKRAKSNTLL